MRDLPYYLIIQCCDCSAYASWNRETQTARLDHDPDCMMRDEPLTLKVEE
jgi:hypothetical protein